jgi:hypothetical protein
MEHEGSIPCSQEPSTSPYHEPDQYSTYHPILSFLRSILILSTHLRLGLPSGLFASGFPTNLLYTILVSPIRATYSAHLFLLVLIFLIILCEEYKLETPHYVVFFSFHFIPLRSKYSPQHPVLQHPQSVFLS